MKLRILAATIATIGLATTGSFAQIRETVSTIAFVFNGQQLQISQAAQMDTTAVAQHFKRPNDCRDVCIAPTLAAAGVATVTEQDVIGFVQSEVARGAGLLLDSRTAQDRATGYIATSVNVPLELLEPDNPFLADILIAMGAVRNGATMDFSAALPLIVFDDGPTSFDAPDLIQALRATGYPADKIRYYRGGMQVWTALGLSVEDA